MTKRDESRRAFLVGTVAGAGAVAAGAALPESAEAQVQPPVQHDHAAGGKFEPRNPLSTQSRPV